MRRRLPPLELLPITAVLGVALVVLRRLGVRSWATLCALGAAAGALALGVSLAPRTSRAGGVELPVRVERARGFASSDACRSCHPSEHASWHQSFHRSMTEAASGSSVRAPWQGAFDWRGRSYRLSRRGEEFWVTLPDPDLSAQLARQGRPLEAVGDVDRRVVMTTGSHHYQAYWVPGARGNELWQLPFVYHFESQRFIPRHDAFLQPESDPVYFARWNSNCIQCHSVAGEPRHELESDRFESRVAELGIACEACHGPGAAHVEHERDPLLRLRQRAGAGAAASDIVNPARLGAERSSQVCGQCHSYFVPRDADTWWTSGFASDYRPGDDLDAAQRLIEYVPGADPLDPELDASLGSLFYPDGTIRVGGREWNGLSRSACFRQGHGDRQLACTSCHRLHGGSRDDQLGERGGTDGACSGCHVGYAAAEHTHHVPGSSGSECMNCHMPRTTYALFKAIRSHRISVPTADDTPGAASSACNLCHQNRSRAWAAAELATWAQARWPRALSAPTDAETADEPRSALAVALLGGDAAARVIAASALGDGVAREVSGSGWQAQLLLEALDDPYAAVRFVARSSLRSLPGFEGFEFDFVAPRERRLERVAEGRVRAAAAARGRPLGASAPLPLDADGLLRQDVIRRLVDERDDTPIRIAE